MEGCWQGTARLTFGHKLQDGCLLKIIYLKKKNLQIFFSDCKAPWECAFEGIGVHECWSLFKSHPLRAQKQAIPKCWKSSRWDRRPAWLSRDPLELRQKKKVYRH